MLDILPPKKVVYEDLDGSRARLVIEPLYPGYGTTLGNALRRVLLSSLHGAAIVSMKVQGVDHEFSQIQHVKEDMIQIMLNVKQISVKMNTTLDEPVTMRLKATGEKVVTAGDIDAPSDLTIGNPEHVIATLTDPAANLDIEFTVVAGRGYEPVSERLSENNDVGVIEIDAIYSPVVKVGMKTHNVRVDNMTNYDSLTLDIETDGTRTPEDAVNEALDIIISQFRYIKTNASAQDDSVEADESESDLEIESTSDVDDVSEETGAVEEDSTKEGDD